MNRLVFYAVFLVLVVVMSGSVRAQESEALDLADDMPLIEDALLDIEEPVIEEPLEELTAEIDAAVNGDEDGPVAEDLMGDVFEEEAIIDLAEEPVIDLSEEPVATDEGEPDAILDLFGEGPAAGGTPAAEPEPDVFALDAEPIEVGPASAKTVSTLIGQEAIKRRAFKEHLRDTLSRGDEALQQAWVDDAIAFYEEALRLVQQIGDRPEDRPEKEAAQVGLAEALYRKAQKLLLQEDFEQALDYARRATGEGHKDGPTLAGEIRYIIQNPPVPDPPVPTPRWGDEDYLKENETITGFLRLGREHVAAGELQKAKAMYQTVVSRDPENTEAIRMLEKIGLREYDAATKEYAATRRAMMAEVRESWNRDYQVGIEEKSIWDEWKQRNPQQPVDSDRLRIIEKMKGIRIPEINFRQANIHDVIEFLQGASVEFDVVPEGDEDSGSADEERGVNLILNLSAGQPMVTKVEEEDPFAIAAGDAPAETDGIAPITFSARYVTLYEALKIVTDVANLKFRVTGTVVMILRRNAPEADIIHRRYDVLPTMRSRIDEVQPDLDRGRGRSGDFIELTNEAISTGPTDWKKFFADLGVDWPAGSSINYVSSIGKLIVANTPENLTIFEQILGELNVVPNQIEIEARFVEVAQSDLDALGFEWNLTDNWEIAHKEGSGNALGSMERIEMSAGSITDGLRYSADALQGTVNDTVATVASVLTNPEVALVIHALSQSGNTDLLSAPRITTKSGYEATLKVVKEYIYPTAYNISSASDTGGGNNNNNVAGPQINIPIAEPTDFETREVGVILSVLPEVSPEGQMINLEMRPEVIGEPEWKDYGYDVPVQGVSYHVPLEQPFFPSRSLTTSILVYNGATVVMGGMITEIRSSVDDKIPFLGDIPIIGRLFRSKVEESQKRNLLIFVTARLVDPAGKPVKRAETRLGDKLAEGTTGSADL